MWKCPPWASASPQPQHKTKKSRRLHWQAQIRPLLKPTERAAFNLFLRWPHLKCLLYFKSAFDNNGHFVLLTQLWFLAGRTQLLELLRSTTGFWGDLEKGCLDLKPVYIFQFTKPSESNTSPSGHRKLPSSMHLGMSSYFCLEDALWNAALWCLKCECKWRQGRLQRPTRF